MTRWLTIGLLVAALAACDDDGDNQTDAGPGDAGQGMDAAMVDAGDPGDDDAGTDEDAGADEDAGTSEDAGTDEDAGTSDDAGMDAGTSDDAGMTDDGGTGGLGGDTCEDALDVTAGGTFTGTTEDATDDYSPSISCVTGGAASGRDVAYFVQPSVATSYRVTVTPLSATFDPMLYAQLICGTGSCVAGTVFNGPGVMEQITFTAAAGQRVHIVVDGELGSRGPYGLSVVIE